MARKVKAVDTAVNAVVADIILLLGRRTYHHRVVVGSMHVVGSGSSSGSLGGLL